MAIVSHECFNEKRTLKCLLCAALTTFIMLHVMGYFILYRIYPLPLLVAAQIVPFSLCLVTFAASFVFFANGIYARYQEINSIIRFVFVV